jgi:hypothetical protein
MQAVSVNQLTVLIDIIFGHPSFPDLDMSAHVGFRPVQFFGLGDNLSVNHDFPTTFFRIILNHASGFAHFNFSIWSFWFVSPLPEIIISHQTVKVKFFLHLF